MTAPIKFATREGWLAAATAEVLAVTCRGETGKPGTLDISPATIRVSCGFPSSRPRKAIGECWATGTSDDGTNAIFISPTLENPVEVLATLLHELIHAQEGPKAKHGKDFKKHMKPLGLEGPVKATGPTADFPEQWGAVLAVLGPYPHAALHFEEKETKPQKGRMLKAECPDCGYIIRTSKKCMEEKGLPTCPCGAEFVAEPGADDDDDIDVGDF
jgi:predicted RNA-binding Zn-ribbon protein involved in translation (DUF1610 family)